MKADRPDLELLLLEVQLLNRRPQECRKVMFIAEKGKIRKRKEFIQLEKERLLSWCVRVELSRYVRSRNSRCGHFSFHNDLLSYDNDNDVREGM